MANLRLILSIALPTVTALIGFLYFFGRRRGNGKGGKAITKGDNSNNDLHKTQAHVGGGDALPNENHSPVTNHRDVDQTVQRRRLERDKDEEIIANGQKPVARDVNSIQNRPSGQCVSPAQKVPTTESVKDSNRSCDLSHMTEKSEDFTVLQSCQVESWSGGAEDWPSKSLLNEDVSKSSSSSTSLPEEVVYSAELDIKEVQPQRIVTILTRSPGPRDSVHTSVLSASESLAKPSESSQDGVGAKISNHDNSMSASSTDALNDQVSASQPNSISVSNSDQIAASKSYSVESSLGCDARQSVSVNSTSSSNVMDSSSASVILEVSSDTKSDLSNTDVSHEQTSSADTSSNGTTAITSEETSKQESPSAASENKLLMDSANKTAASTADTVQCSDKVSDQNGSAAVAGSSESPGCDSNSEASNDSGRGGSVTEPIPLPVMAPDTVRYEFNFPSELCGRLIGKNGRNINLVKEKSGANIALKNNPCTPNFQICVIEGSQSEIDKALGQIRRKFPRGQFPQVDFTPLTQVVQEAPVLMPDIMQLNLPEGVSVDVVVSNIVDAGHIFVQQPTHPTFPSLERLNQFMLACYTQDHMVPQLPRPIEVGVICAAFMVDGWFRAQVVNVSDNSDEVDIKYVDYGGYARLQSSMLKQIRSDFMTLPFQAVECYMGNITPLQEEEYFSEQGSSVLEELTQGKLLQAQVVNRAEDGIPYIHIYQISGNRVLFINREMVNRKVVRWIEILQ